MTIEYLFYANQSDPTATDKSDRFNQGIDEVPSLLEKLRERGNHLRFVNSANEKREELMNAYIRDAAVPAALNKYRVRRVFGTNRQPGLKFANLVPALAVRDPSGQSHGNIYPHEKTGRVVTIKDFLTALLAAALDEPEPPNKRGAKKRRATKP